ncbi:uncharacterized protein LOC106167652 [Lingula anatina]|uniref:Uncharacterized protein LOC106167652 n=1 Tax=Lingula anatina TaxID=7574 RepID=A0A1S3IUR4_LINAN|nr:uncharacterized protein LOC106167652 [Lingula anatina]|eukprot:XP_013401945.1 uncharacterized protein LOC106167652 [Lingula anatina]
MTVSTARCRRCFECFIWICRIWGLITAVGLWGIGVEAAFRHHPLGFYLIGAAFIMTFLETVFLTNLCVLACTERDSPRRPPSCGVKFWSWVMWFDNWKKGIFYLILCIPCFIQPQEVWMAIISGVMMIISAIFYCIKSIKIRQDNINTIEETYDRRPRLR